MARRLMADYKGRKALISFDWVMLIRVAKKEVLVARLQCFDCNLMVQQGGGKGEG